MNIKEKNYFGSIKEFIKTIFFALLIAGLIRTLFFQPFWIPSGSMKPNLLIGDYIFVNKFVYGYSKYSCPFSLCPFGGRIFYSEPKRGDVVVFRHPINGKDYVKRLIGLPGDEISIKNGRLTLNGKKINTESISKLINLSENHSISELIDNCLAQNKKKIISILNENNFSNEDCIMITRSFMMKAKKLLALSKTFETNKNIDLTISSAKPPIFWKEKEITKQQIYKWKPKNIKQLIYALSETELLIKKNINNSINLITDFILSQSSTEANS